VERESPRPSGVRSGSPLGWHDPDGSGHENGGGPGSWEGQGPRSKTAPRSGGVGVVCGGAVRWGCWVRPALLALPVGQRQTAEAGVTAAAWGCHRRDVLDLHSMRWPRPADRDGARRLRVCVADVPVVLGPSAGQPTFAPAAGGLGGVRGVTRRLRLAGI